MTQAKIPPAAYEPVWCGWGYQRDFTIDQMLGTLPKARELGLVWAVLDDGWQTALGDWYLDPAKFPRGDADMIAFVKAIKAAGMKPRLWIAPLAAQPSTELLRDHPDMLLLDKSGAPQDITGWDSFYLCPAYRADGEMDPGPHPQDHRRVGLRGPEDRRPASQRRRALLQSGAQARPAGGVGREAAGHLEGGPRGGHRDQSGRGDRVLSVRHVLFDLQHDPRQPGGRLRPDVVLAGPPQGQDDQGADGTVGGLCGRPRRAERPRQRFRIDRRHRRGGVDQVHLAARSAIPKANCC